MAAVEITIDEKFCRGCSLCVEICPTAVFSFNESNKLAVVENASECFGCLSCCEICPSGAISHNCLDVSESYYHDSGALDMARRLGEQRFSVNAPNDPDKIENAIIDLCILFYNYLAGYLGKVCSIRPRLMGVERGDTCSYAVKVYQTGPL